MLPSRIFALEKFPLNANGKVDRKAITQWVAQNIESQNISKEKLDNTSKDKLSFKNNAMYFLDYGKEMFALTQKLFKIPRSLSGNGNRET